MGHWGTHSARRRATTHSGCDVLAPLASLPPAPIPATAQCSNCETWAVLAGDRLPRDWVLIKGQALCSDCAPPPAGELRRAIADSAAKARPVTCGTRGRYRGCRIGHEVALGVAAIQIRPGATPPEGRDERVQFLLTPEEIDQLIIELYAIRAELVAGKTN